VLSSAPAEGTLNQSDLVSHLRRLRSARIDGKLIFVLGSGINKSYRLPDWRQLLERLLRACGRMRDGSEIDTQIGIQLQRLVPDPLLQAAIVRQGYLQPKLFVEAIEEQLREQSEHPAKDERKPLYRVADLVMSQFEADRHRHIAVLTFNYDDLLEKALRARADERDHPWIQSISSDEDYASAIHASGVFVYHLHGYVKDHESPIFDAASYLRVLGSPGRHWSWDCLTANLLQRDSGVLFIGLSLVDPSLRLLLTQWADRGLPLSGLYISAPPPLPTSIAGQRTKGGKLQAQLKVAHMTRDLVRLFDEVLEHLSLIPYHVTVWEEINDLLEVIAYNEQLTPVSSVPAC